LRGEPPLEAHYTTIKQLASACNDGAQACPLEQRYLPTQLVISTGSEYEIKSGTLEAGIVIGVVAAGEVYCFAKCSTGVKVGLGVADVGSAIFGYLMYRIARGLAN
jgi:hypothetical protein